MAARAGIWHSRRDGYAGSGREGRTRKGREADGEATVSVGKEGRAREMGEA